MITGDGIVYQWSMVTLPDVPQRSNTAVLMLATGDRCRLMYERWGHTFKEYAIKVGADFLLVSGESANPHFPTMDSLFAMHAALDKYDRVVMFDADIEVVDVGNAPNMFTEIPDTHLGLFDERLYYYSSIIEDGIDRVIKIAKDYGHRIHRPTRYVCASIVVASACHRDVFGLPTVPFVNRRTYEQDLMQARVFFMRQKAVYMGPEIQWVDKFGNHAKEQAHFHHYPATVPYEKDANFN